MQKNFGPLFIIVAAFLWSLDGILRKSLSPLPPLVIVFYEHCLGALILFPLLFRASEELKTIRPREIFSLGWVSLIGGLLGTFFYTAALGEISFAVVVLLQKLQPVFAIFLAWLILKERVTPIFLLWAFVAVVGAYLVSFKDLTVDLQTGFGSLLAVGAAFAWGSSTVLGKHVLRKLTFSTAATLRFFLTSIFAAVPFLVGFSPFVAVPSLTTHQIWVLLTITFSTGMVAILIYYYGLKQVDAKVSTICELFFPFSAVVIDWVWYQKVLSQTQFLGAALLLVAIYKVSTIDRKKER